MSKVIGTIFEKHQLHTSHTASCTLHTLENIYAKKKKFKQ